MLNPMKFAPGSVRERINAHMIEHLKVNGYIRNDITKMKKEILPQMAKISFRTYIPDVSSFLELKHDANGVINFSIKKFERKNFEISPRYMRKFAQLLGKALEYEHKFSSRLN